MPKRAGNAKVTIQGIKDIDKLEYLLILWQ